MPAGNGLPHSPHSSRIPFERRRMPLLEVERGPWGARMRSLVRLFNGNLSLSTVAVCGMGLLALLATVYAARIILLPVILAVMLSLLLSPVLGPFSRMRVPRSISAGIVVLGLLAALIWGVYTLSQPAQHWMSRGPEILHELEDKVREIKLPAVHVARFAAEIEKLTRLSDATPVEIERQSLAQFLLASTRDVVLGGSVTLVLLYFLLASGDGLLRKVVRLMPTLSTKRRTVQIARRIRGDIFKYLLTVTVINAGLGVVGGFLLAALGMPSPVLFGALLAGLNFLPYLGPAIAISTIGLVALVTFDGTYAMVIVASCLSLTTIEGNVLTPLILGHRLSLSPVAIVLGLLFWGWIWGVPGALLTVPILMTLKVICDHVRPLTLLGELLGRSGRRPARRAPSLGCGAATAPLSSSRRTDPSAGVARHSAP